MRKIIICSMEKAPLFNREKRIFQQKSSHRRFPPYGSLIDRCVVLM